MKPSENQTLCPSASPEKDALLLGVVGPNGQVSILPQPLPVTESFLEKVAEQHSAPAKHFRFANKCVKSGCAQWSSGQCGIIAGLMQDNAGLPEPPPEVLPRCEIRPRCRWHKQHGPRACVLCPYVVTDGRVEVPADAAALADPV